MTSDQPQPVTPAKPRRRRLTRIAVVIGLVVAAGLGVLAGALLVDRKDDGGEVTNLPILDTTLQRIVAGPEPFIGDDVLFGGQVREILSPRAFTVGQPGFFGPDLLVVSKTPLAAPSGRTSARPILEGDTVTVAGDVRRFDFADFDRDVAADLRREFDSFVGDDLGEREGEPAVRADSVVVNSRTTVVAEGVTAEEVGERPTAFYGKVVAVTGEITDVLDSGALIVDDRLVALTADFGERRPREGARVEIIGPVRPFDADQLRQGGRGSADDDVFGNFANRPAVVAQSIEYER